MSHGLVRRERVPEFDHYKLFLMILPETRVLRMDLASKSAELLSKVSLWEIPSFTFHKVRKAGQEQENFSTSRVARLSMRTIYSRLNLSGKRPQRVYMMIRHAKQRNEREEASKSTA